MAASAFLNTVIEQPLVCQKTNHEVQAISTDEGCSASGIEMPIGGHAWWRSSLMGFLQPDASNKYGNLPANGFVFFQKECEFIRKKNPSNKNIASTI
jgi:hypothetical protein